MLIQYAIFNRSELLKHQAVLRRDMATWQLKWAMDNSFKMSRLFHWFTVLSYQRFLRGLHDMYYRVLPTILDRKKLKIIRLPPLLPPRNQRSPAKSKTSLFFILEMEGEVVLMSHLFCPRDRNSYCWVATIDYTIEMYGCELKQVDDKLSSPSMPFSLKAVSLFRS